MVDQENVDEKEVRLAVDLYVCKVSKEDFLLLAHKLGFQMKSSKFQNLN